MAGPYKPFSSSSRVPAQRVCVVGAGVIGSATACLLARAGHQVTVLEAREAPGLGASRANGGQLSYSHVEPLASPETLRQLPGMLRDRESALRLRLTGEWSQLRWAWQFLRACRRDQVEVATGSLLALSFLSRHELKQASETEGLHFGHEQPGKLVLHDTARSLAAARQQVDFQRQFGCEQSVVDMAGCLRIEPALEACAAQVKGGVWSADDAVGDPFLLTRQLLVRAQALGADVRYRTTVTGAVKADRGSRIEALHTDQGAVGADIFVLANGVGAAALGRRLGLRLPVYPLKGYSITLPFRDETEAPVASVTDLRRKIVYARLGDQLRVAGLVELVGHDLRVDPERIRFLVRCVEEMFPGACDLTADPQAWAGLRPATPTSMPLIGPARYSNLLLNVGHGGLGFTLAMGSARLIERQVAGEPGVVGGPFAYLGGRG